MSRPRVALIGNSHIGAIRDAHVQQLSNALADFDARFFPTLSVQLEGAQVQGGALVPATPEARKRFRDIGGSETITLAEFDHLVIVGHGLGIHEAMGAVGRCWAVGFPRPGGRHATVSRAVFDQIATRAALAALGARLAGMLAPHLKNPLVLVPDPLRARAGDERAQWQANEDGLQDRFRAVQAAFLAAMAQLESLPARLVAHDPDTLCDNGTATRDDLVLGFHDGGAMRHGNAAYGALMLPHIRAALLANGPAP